MIGTDIWVARLRRDSIPENGDRGRWVEQTVHVDATDAPAAILAIHRDYRGWSIEHLETHAVRRAKSMASLVEWIWRDHDA